MTQSQHCNINNNNNDDNVMRVSVWFEFFDGLFNVKSRDVWEGNMTTRWEIQIEHICSLGFQDIREG